MNVWHYGSLPIARFDGKTMKPLTLAEALEDTESDKRTKASAAETRAKIRAVFAVERISDRPAKEPRLKGRAV